MKQNNVQKSFRRAGRAAALALGAALVSILPLRAQEVGSYEGADPAPVTGGFRVTTGLGYRADADIDGGGDFNELRFSVAGAGFIRFNDQWSLIPIVSYRFSHYDWSFRDPWEDIHTVRTTPLVQYVLDDHWTLFGGPALGFSAESGADLGDSFVFGGIVGARYRVSPSLTVGGALGVFSQIEDNASVVPLPIVSWQINEQWMLDAGFTEVAAAGGVGAEISYKINDRWSAGAGLQLQRKRFRLSDDGPAPDGVGEDSSIPVYAKLAWQAWNNGSFELIGGVSAGGNVRIEDKNGHKIADDDYDPSGLIGLRGVFTF
jgi:long-subunit fatty acid transport protein